MNSSHTFGKHHHIVLSIHARFFSSLLLGQSFLPLAQHLLALASCRSCLTVFCCTLFLFASFDIGCRICCDALQNLERFDAIPWAQDVACGPLTVDACDHWMPSVLTAGISSFSITELCFHAHQVFCMCDQTRRENVNQHAYSTSGAGPYWCNLTPYLLVFHKQRKWLRWHRTIKAKQFITIYMFHEAWTPVLLLTFVEMFF